MVALLVVPSCQSHVSARSSLPGSVTVAWNGVGAPTLVMIVACPLITVALAPEMATVGATFAIVTAKPSWSCAPSLSAMRTVTAKVPSSPYGHDAPTLPRRSSPMMVEVTMGVGFSVP